ncbi:hypothetical protein [Methylobacterium sp. SyP6R]|uniref:hypothetical protein n=1 Tax=Methylobacterium sp. SyP6R TaxID=2718876 RepID=UPI001F36A49B|nr:hypothetical protein [Methylobacterium sp. SyP6R]MCF4129996.1 hypothetical protein [Methylobacterium sp. SyP6R]
MTAGFGLFMWARRVGSVELVEEDDPVFGWRERLLDAFDGLARNAPTAHQGKDERRWTSP